jgi:hypothetical protein
MDIKIRIQTDWDMYPSHVYCIWGHHTCISAKKQCKNQSLFFIVAIQAKFSAIYQVHATMVPEKFNIIKKWQFAQKTRWRVLAVRAMVVRVPAHIVPTFTNKKFLSIKQANESFS